MVEEFVGLLSKVLYASPQGEFAVAEFIALGTARKFKAKGPLGVSKNKTPVGRYRLFGSWETHARYGESFQTLFACQEDPGQPQSPSLSHSFRTLLERVQKAQLPVTVARDLFFRLGPQALQQLEDNPFGLLQHTKGVGFSEVDALALASGVSPLDPKRLEAALAFALQLAAQDGHTALPRGQLLHRMSLLLAHPQHPAPPPQWILQTLRESYQNQPPDGLLPYMIYPLGQREHTLFSLPALAQAEERIAMQIQALKKKPIAKKSLSSSLMAKAPHIPWGSLSEEQMKGVHMSLQEPVSVLTGGPGCGKTYVLKAVHAVHTALGRKVVLAAPTGMAAKRMQKSIGATAHTLHRLLHLSGGQDEGTLSTPLWPDPKETTEHTLKNVDLVIVDESSMLSVDLMDALMGALVPGTSLLLVGDVDQLPSVGPGNCLLDVINSGLVATTCLTRIFRQASESPIPTQARGLLQGQVPQFGAIGPSSSWTQPAPLAWLPCGTDDFHQSLSHFLTHTVPQLYQLDPLKDVQILTPMRKTPSGQTHLNTLVQNLLNPGEDKGPSVTLLEGQTLRLGDKVMQTRNNYEKQVFNGDLGRCVGIANTGNETAVTIQFDNRKVLLDATDLLDIQLSYAMTIHKSQGSEFPLCVVPLFQSHHVMLNRNLFYTAITRASQWVVIFGEESAMRRAVSHKSALVRCTTLSHRLKELLPS